MGALRRARRGPLVVLGVLAVVLTLVLVPLTSGEAGEVPGSDVRSELDGQSVRLSMPGSGIEPKGLVMWFHGQGGDVDIRMDDPFLDTLRRDGWVVASSDFHDEAWGNPASTRDVQLLADWAREETGLEPTVFVAGSMGGAVSLNAMRLGEVQPDCWYGVRPAIALDDMENVPGARRFIGEAFGGKPPDELDPVQNLDELPTDVRYRVIASRDDKEVLFDENTEPLVEKLVGGDAEVSLESVSGGHQDESHFNGRDLRSFANSCLG